MSDDWLRTSRGPSRAPGRYDVPPSKGTPTMATSSPCGSSTCGSRMKVAGCAKRGEVNEPRGWWGTRGSYRFANLANPANLGIVPPPPTMAPPRSSRLHAGLSTVEYFTFGFGTMIGVGWLVLMDDWLTRGGPGGGILGFLIGGLLLFPIAHTYGRLVQRIQDAGAEIGYTEGVMPPFVSFAAGWT